MVKIFLVEDEVVVRQGIRDNIDWEREGFSFVGEASDGELAFPLIQKHRPDIVITDIKMPFMDGLELSRLIRKELPDTRILILSGYNEFDYAKEAIQIGITDYLVKPISSEKLLESVSKVAAQIEEAKEQKRLYEQFYREMQENRQLEKQHFFEDMLSNRFSMPEIIEQGKKLDMDLSAPYYAVALFQVFHDSTSNEQDSYSEALVAYSEAFNLSLKDRRNVYAFDRRSEGWAILFMGESPKEITALQESCFQEWCQLCRNLDIFYFGGVGLAVMRLRELVKSYEEAAKGFSYRYFTVPNRILHADAITEDITAEHRELCEMNMIEKIDVKTVDVGKMDRRVLSRFLKNGLLEEVDMFINDYFEGLGSRNMESLFFRQYITTDMYFGTVGFLEELGKDTECIVERCGNISGVSKAFLTVEATVSFLKHIISEAIMLRDNVCMKKYTKVIEAAKLYIQENFTREDISLNMVAASVNISPSHFSKIFSQETGSTFIEYLTGVRMERAKELLRCSNMKSTQIGYTIGYKDSHYFSYIFKKTQECTPKEYRQRTIQELPAQAI